jgi:hypothetical protein
VLLDVTLSCKETSKSILVVVQSHAGRLMWRVSGKEGGGGGGGGSREGRKCENWMGERARGERVMVCLSPIQPGDSRC